MKHCLIPLALILLTGCASLEQAMYKRHLLISLHELIPPEAPRMGKFERAMVVDGRTVYFRKIAVLTATRIEAAEVREMRNGGTQMILHLNRRGELLWSQAAAEYHGRRLAFMVDGIYRDSFVTRRYSGTGPIQIPLTLPIAEAREIADAAEKNFETFSNQDL